MTGDYPGRSVMTRSRLGWVHPMSTAPQWRKWGLPCCFWLSDKVRSTYLNLLRRAMHVEAERQVAERAEDPVRLFAVSGRSGLSAWHGAPRSPAARSANCCFHLTRMTLDPCLPCRSSLAAEEDSSQSRSPESDCHSFFSKGLGVQPAAAALPTRSRACVLTLLRHLQQSPGHIEIIRDPAR